MRKVEAIAKELQNGLPLKKEKEAAPANHDFDILRDHLSARFKTPVQFSMDKRGRGRITIPFNNEEELERLMANIDRIGEDS